MVEYRAALHGTKQQLTLEWKAAANWLRWRVLARPRPVCKNIWGEIGDSHVTAAARIVPHPFLGISVSHFRKFKCTTRKNFRECEGYHTLFECVVSLTLTKIFACGTLEFS